MLGMVVARHRRAKLRGGRRNGNGHKPKVCLPPPPPFRPCATMRGCALSLIAATATPAVLPCHTAPTGDGMASACAGWQLYFPDEPFDDGFPYLDRIDRLKQYFADVGRPAGLKDGCTMTTLSVNVDYQALATAADFAECEPTR